MKELRYLESEKEFLEFSYLALKGQFRSKKEFVSFFTSIKGTEQKNLFLKTASFYLFLVKQGDWFVDIPNSNRKIDYLTDTYKYIAISSLIESLRNQKYRDFYSFLISRKSNIKFPIKNRNELECWYRKYKEEFGSIQQFIGFFKFLSSSAQKTLIQRLEIEHTDPTIENLSRYLYELRSMFIHKAELILNMSGITTISGKRNKIVICKLSITDLMNFFEEGLVAYFKNSKI
ncbi:MAG: hypothetical protein KJ935_03175 [Candidatus Omnitrophica bacterium]|nr:hypothetical protein [Candidatus Omnitrophota bacterium]